MRTWSEGEAPPTLGHRARIEVDGRPVTDPNQLLREFDSSKQVEPTEPLVPAEVPIPLPPRIEKPLTPERIEPPKGSMGFIDLVQSPSGIADYGIAPYVLRSDLDSRAVLIVPDDPRFVPLHQIRSSYRISNGPLERLQAATIFERFLCEKRWTITRGFSAFGNGGENNFYGTLLLVEHNGELWELPPREEPYPIDYPGEIDRLPEGAIPFMHTQERYNVQFFPQNQNHRCPGIDWMNKEAMSSDFLVFRGRASETTDDGHVRFDKQTWGEWVVRRIKFPGEVVPKSLEQYLLERFGATIDVGLRIITAQEQHIGAIIGNEDGFGRRHIEYIKDALGIDHIEVMTFEEAAKREKQRKTTHGKRIDREKDPLVRTFSTVNEDQAARWDKRGYEVISGGRRQWVVERTVEGITQYLKQRFEATLDVDGGWISIAGDSKLIKFLYGRGCAHLGLLSRLLGKPVRVIKTRV